MIKNETMLFAVAIFAIAVMGVLIALSMLNLSGNGNSGETFISVSATGSATAAPQLATITVIMNGTGDTSAVATSSLAFTLSRFNATVSPYISGNSSRVTTESYSVYKTNTTYTATEVVSVQLPSVLNVSSILGALSLIQNAYIQGVNTDFSPQQVQTLTQQALTAALANATAQAQVLAPNKTLTARNISISSYFRYPYPYALNSASAPSSNPIFFTGKEALTDTVTVVFSHK